MGDLSDGGEEPKGQLGTRRTATHRHHVILRAAVEDSAVLFWTTRPLGNSMSPVIGFPLLFPKLPVVAAARGRIRCAGKSLSSGCCPVTCIW